MAAKKKTAAKKAAPIIEMMSVESIAPYERNSRTHSDQQVDQVAASIREFGFTNPVLITDKNIIIAGHCRVEAAKRLGIAEVPCLRQSQLSAKQAKAYVIADNQLALNAGWDLDLLKVEIKGLDDFDVSLLGFDDDFLTSLLNEEKQGLTDPDAVPDTPENPVTVLGDVWNLGNHTIVCGDCTDVAAWERLNIENGMVLFTSPPYNVGDAQGLRDKYKKGQPKDNKFYKNYDDNLTRESYGQLIRDFVGVGFSYCDAVVVNIQMLAGNKTDVLKWMDEYSSHICDIVTWDKLSGSPHIQCGILTSRFEWLVVLSKENATRKIPFASWQGKVSNVYAKSSSGDKENSSLHGATFPVHLPEFVIGDMMNRSRGVVDCFCGTGTSIIAAEKLGKTGYGIELNPMYVDVAITRWQNFTGQKAIHQDGRLFDEVAGNRSA